MSSGSKIYISVIVPVYNAEKFLRKCMESIIHQTLKEIEIICINDGSIDSSKEIIEELILKDKRIILIEQENLKQAKARNNGLKIARGKYISFVDSDDWIEKTFLETLYNEAVGNKVDIVASSVIKYTHGEFERENYVTDWTFYNKKKNILITPDEKIGTIFSCAVWNKIYRREFLESNNIYFCEDLFLEDVTFTHIACIKANKIITVKNANYFYRVEGNSFMSNAQVVKSTLDMINMTKKSRDILTNYSFTSGEDKKKYFQILDSFEIYNLEGWFNQINKKYKRLFYKKMKLSFKKIDINTNSFIGESCTNFYNKVVECKNLDSFLLGRNYSKIFSIINSNEYKIFNLLGLKITIKKKNRITSEKIYKDLEKLKYLIKNSNVISFDIFDTLLLRPYIEPKNVFKHLEENEKSSGFYELREKAEYEILKRKGIEYVNYDEIYDILPKKFHALKDKEIELERETLYANPEMKKIFDYAKSLNKRIILVSDMYYSSDIINNFLNKNGYAGYEKIYVSAECRLAKYNCSLFKHIIDDLNISPKDILHIGDNEHSDYKCAVDMGFNAFHYIKPIDQFLSFYPKFKFFYEGNRDNLTAGIILGMLVKKYITSDKKNIEKTSYWKYFGYFIGGSFCYGLTKFVYDEVVRENIKEVIFVARDGYTIQKIFNLIKKDKDIKDFYLYAPRIINLITSLDYSNEFNWTYKIKSIINTYREISKKFNKICPKSFKSYQDRVDFFEKNKHIIEPLAKDMSKAYEKYISSFGIKDKKIALFDISTFSFSSINLLQKNLNNKEIHGLYWFIGSEERYSYLCKAYQEYMANSIIGYDIIELIATAPELPVKYMDRGGDLIRIDNKYERIRIALYKKISDGELEFSKDLIETFKNNEVKFECNTLINFINSFMNNINKIDLKYFRFVKHASSEDHKAYIDIIDRDNRLISIKNNQQYTIYTIFGIRISIKKRNKNY